MMKSKSSFRRFHPRRITRFATLVAILLTSVFVWKVHNAQADSAPDWLRSAAQESGDYPKDTVAVVLLDERQTTVKDNGDIETRYRRAYKLLRPEARDEYGFVRVPFDNQTKITYLKAWTITPDGHEMEVKEKDAAEIGVSTYEVFSDNREKILSFPEANPGSVVGYEFAQKHRPFVLEDNWWFQVTIPVRTARFTLQLCRQAGTFPPFGLTIPTKLPGNRAKYQRLGAQGYFRRGSRAGHPHPWEVVGGRLGLKYFPRDPAIRGKTSGSWKDLGLWYDGLTRTSQTPSPDIKKKTAELTSGISDPLAKIKALSEYMQRQIRYAAIEIGIGGYQPHIRIRCFRASIRRLQRQSHLARLDAQRDRSPILLRHHRH